MRYAGLILLAGLSFSAAAVAERFKTPSAIVWGATTAELQRNLRSQCPKIVTRKIDPPFLDRVKKEQLQIDCDGFRFRGSGRHVEFVIKDGRLVMVWLMVRPEEKQSIVRDMKAAFGKPSSINANYVAFKSRRVAWRNKPAEILFYTPEVDGDVTPDFR